MIYRRLGKSGLRLSAFSFGSWATFGSKVDERGALELMSIAYDAGVNFFDNAEAYASGKSEEIMGAALKKAGWSRDSYTVSTKVYWGGDKPTQMGLSRKHIVDACHAGLKRLQVDYLDLYFCHRPDIDTPIEETVWAMSDLVRQGKVLYWGTSEWNAQQITEAHEVARANHLHAPVMEQPEYNLFNRQKVEAEYLPLYERYGLGTTTWSPLATGILTGKYNDGIPQGSRLADPDNAWLKDRIFAGEGKLKIEKARKLTALARDAGMSLTHLSIAWCLTNPRVSTVILGASSAKQLQDNLKSMEVLPKLTPDLLARIEEIVQTKPEAAVDWKEM